MKLLLKFNLILLLLFGAGMLLVARLSRTLLMQDARAHVLQQAKLMAQSAQAVRNYTSEEVEPLLEDSSDAAEKFLPQTIPNYAANTIFKGLRKEFPDYAYREAALNPINLEFRAVDWETDIINHFRNYPGEKELIGERDTPTGRSLYLAHPIVTEDLCLGCHGSVDQAMPMVVKTYGSVNGYGWKDKEIIGAQIVSVPMAVPIRLADEAYRRLLLNLAGIFLVTLVAVDLSLYFLIVRPVQKLASMADRISRGDQDLQELPVRGNDEISALTRSFNRMYVSVAKAMKMLKGYVGEAEKTRKLPQ